MLLENLISVMRVKQNDMSNGKRILDEYSECFEGLACIKDVILHISVDQSVLPVIHPPRKVAGKLRDK